MKNWMLNKRVNNLSKGLADPSKTDTTIDWRCLSEPEIELMEKVQEIQEKYSPGLPPQDVIEKNADLWYKGLEIFRRRTTELFVETVPATFCCDELEEWYFKEYFYNFCLDFIESLERLRSMPKDLYNKLFAERKEMGLLDRVFRLKRYPPPTPQTQSDKEDT